MVKIGSDISGRITVSFPYNAAGIVARLKTVIPERQWHARERFWSFRRSEPALTAILTALSGEEIETDPSLQELLPSTSVDLLLDRARHLIRLKHYSVRTEKSYLPWMARYLAFHHNRDPREMGGPEIEAFLSHLPYALERKYKNAGTEWSWQYLFPAKTQSRDPRAGILRRHHVHENTLQSAIREAARMAGLDKRVSVHTLRHYSESRHLIEAGCGLHHVQLLLGHKSPTTTTTYLHVSRKNLVAVVSPLDMP
jgi:hypothetical protein